MLEYFAYTRYKKHQLEKKDKKAENNDSTAAAHSPSTRLPAMASQASGKGREVPALGNDAQSFFNQLALTWNSEREDDGDGEADRPPLPPRLKTPELTWDSDSESFVRGDASKTGATETSRDSGGGLGRRLSQLLGRRGGKTEAAHAAHLAVPGQTDVDAASAGPCAVRRSEEERERDDLARVLEDLDAATGAADADGPAAGRSKKMALALSAESAALVRRFVVVLKDVVTGVPTAADDLRSLLDDRDGTLARGFERLPSGLRKLVAQLPSKLTSSLAPELLAAAAASQGIAYEHAEDGSAAKNAAKTLLLPLLTKPNAIVKVLKAIMNALKLRWPAFIGTSAIWSVALFLLLFVLWYCHKRGREVRLDKEASVDGQLLVEVPLASQTAAAGRRESASAVKLPPPPIGGKTK